ncbi:MAG: hypothetical protein J5928_05065 [Firmicutes bacterium]|nr:hypothetical protein [Bacillota bacterium]
MKKETIKNVLFTIAFPIVMYIIMEAIVYAAKGTHVITSMLDVKSIIRNAGMAAMIAFALSFNLGSGRIDLSLGAQRLAGTIIGGVIALKLGLSGVWLMVFAIIFGALFGFLTGLMFVTFRVPPIVLGIGMGLIIEVIPYVATKGVGLNLFGKPNIAVLSETWFIVTVVIIVGIVIYLLLNKTRFGYELNAIQGSQLISQNSGIKIFKHTVLCYTFAGALVCIAGVMAASYSTTLSASMGLTSSAVVMGNMFPMILGQYIGRKSNSSIGIIVAALTIRIFVYGLTLLEFSEANASVFNMLFFVGFLIFLANEDTFKKKKAEKARIEEAIAYKKELGIA